MQRKGALPGKICALCIPERRFAALFGCMARISCQSQLVLDAWRRYVAREGRFSCPGPLRECMKRKACRGPPLENASRVNIATDGRPRTHHGEILPPSDVGWGSSRAFCHRRALGDASRRITTALPQNNAKGRIRGTPPTKTKEGERFARLLSLFSFTARVAQDLRSSKPPVLGIPLGWGFRVRRNCASRPIC